MSSLRSPTPTQLELIFDKLRGLDFWSAHDDADKSDEDWWSEKQQAGAMWRASCVLARVSADWYDAVRGWRATLTIIDFLNLPRSDYFINDSSVRNVCVQCPALTLLDLSCNVGLTDNVFEILSLNCPRLYSLSVQRTRVRDGVAYLAACNQLQSLDVSSCRLARFSPTSLALLARHTSLTRLNLTGSDQWLTDDGLHALQHCTTLKELLLSTCSVRDAPLVTIAAACKELRLVDLSNCRRLTDESMCELARRCELEDVELANCPAASDRSLRALGASKTRSRLRHLGLSARASGDRRAVTEAGLLALAPACAALTSLNLSCLAAATDAVLAALGTHCACLRVLDLSMCDECTDAGLVALLPANPSIERLNLEGCDALTPTSLSAISASAVRLRWLGTHSEWMLRKPAETAGDDEPMPPSLHQWRLDGHMPGAADAAHEWVELRRSARAFREAMPLCMISRPLCQ